MDVQFVASFSPIVRDRAASTAFYRDGLGLVFEGDAGDYVFTHQLPGVKHFGLSRARSWRRGSGGNRDPVAPPPLPLRHPPRTPRWLVGRVRRAATRRFRSMSARPRAAATQVTARLLSPEGLLVAVCYTPWFHDDPPASS